jgi:hypothetical protein
LWVQYSELGGTQDNNEVSGVNGGSPLYTAALEILDGDTPAVLHDKMDDEISQHQFLNHFLESKGAKPVDYARLKGAVAAIQDFVDDGLFMGQKDPAFLNTASGWRRRLTPARRTL